MDASRIFWFLVAIFLVGWFWYRQKVKFEFVVMYSGGCLLVIIPLMNAILNDFAEEHFVALNALGIAGAVLWVFRWLKLPYVRKFVFARFFTFVLLLVLTLVFLF